MTEPKNGESLTIVRRLDASPARVFDAWTQLDQVRRWHCPSGMNVANAEIDARPGGAYRISMYDPEKNEMHTVAGAYETLEPGRRLVYTWQWEGDNHPNFPETRVTVELAERDGGTELTLTHERLPDKNSRDHHRMGWESVLGNMEAWLAEDAS